MSTEINPQPSRQDGYERRDANTRVLLHYGFWLGVVLVVVLITMKWTFNYLSAKDPLGPPPTPFENARALPPKPQLQVQPRQDLKTYCEQEKNDLESYGWVDSQDGVVRIPVDQAMDRILQQGLPARPAGEATSAAASMAPVGSKNAPKPTGIGGPCSFVVEQEPADSKE
jgi:hypothetical protein